MSACKAGVCLPDIRSGEFSQSGAFLGFLEFIVQNSFVIAFQLQHRFVTQHSQKPSPLFFQTIVQVPLEEFRNIITTLSADRAAEFLAEQTYDNARVMARKNWMVQQTTDWFVYGMICFLLFTIGQVILLAVLP